MVDIASPKKFSLKEIAVAQKHLQSTKDQYKAAKEIYGPIKMQIKAANKRLVEAAKNNDLASLRDALALGAAVDFLNVFDHSILAPLTARYPFEFCTNEESYKTRSSTFEVHDWGGKSALMYAAEKGHTEIVKELIKNGASVDKKSECAEWTALMFATINGHADVVKILVDAGSNLKSVGFGNVTAERLAKDAKFTEIQNILCAGGEAFRPVAASQSMVPVFSKINAG